MAGAVRQPIDLKAFQKYIEEHVSEIKTPIDLKQFGFGQSNPTYQITAADGQRYVMRKKPPGKLLSKTAHRVDREFRIIHALNDTDVPVPRAIAMCDDDSIVGTPFYIMSFLDGRFITEPHFPGLSPAERKEMWHDAIRTLAKFHKVDYSKVGMDSFGKHYGFYDRQIKTFGTVSKAQAEALDQDTKEPVGDIPHFQDMVDFFADKSQQPKDRSSLIMVTTRSTIWCSTRQSLVSLVSWTGRWPPFGHPLSDFANLVGPFTWSMKDSKLGISGKTVGANKHFEAGATPGLPSLDEVTQWYKEESGYDVEKDLTWGAAFGGFRGAVIMQGIAARYALRQASSASAMEYGAMMRPYGMWAYKRVETLQNGPSKSKL